MWENATIRLQNLWFSNEICAQFATTLSQIAQSCRRFLSFAISKSKLTINKTTMLATEMEFHLFSHDCLDVKTSIYELISNLKPFFRFLLRWWLQVSGVWWEMWHRWQAKLINGFDAHAVNCSYSSDSYSITENGNAANRFVARTADKRSKRRKTLWSILIVCIWTHAQSRLDHNETAIRSELILFNLNELT